MKIKFPLLSKIGMLLLIIALGLNSCTKTEYYETLIDSTKVTNVIFEIKPSNWTWNANRDRYEACFNLPEMDRYMYDFGAINAYAFWFDDKNKEIQTQLPFIVTWINKDNNAIFTETLSYDVSYDYNSVCFYIQESNLARYPYLTEEPFEVKVSIVYNLK